MRGHDLRTWIILETETGVRVMRWCLRGGSKGELREANSGKDVGVEEDRLGRMRGWANMCLGGATWRLCLWSEIGKRWKIGLMVEMCWVLCPFFFLKCVHCVSMNTCACLVECALIFLWLHLHFAHLLTWILAGFLAVCGASLCMSTVCIYPHLCAGVCEGAAGECGEVLYSN